MGTSGGAPLALTFGGSVLVAASLTCVGGFAARHGIGACTPFAGSEIALSELYLSPLVKVFGKSLLLGARSGAFGVTFTFAAAINNGLLLMGARSSVTLGDSVLCLRLTGDRSFSCWLPGVSSLRSVEDLPLPRSCAALGARRYARG